MSIVVTDQDVAYLAGIIDGEGCISIRHARPNGKYQSHGMNLIVTNTDTNLIQWLVNKFGGKTFNKTKKKKAHHKQRYNWYVSGQRAAEIIALVKPFLIIKRQQAELALIFAETYKPPWKIRHNRISDAGRMLRERLTQAIQAIQ